MIVWNYGKETIFITTKFKKDPYGGPGIPISQMCVGPGQGIELDILNLKPIDPNEKICEICLLPLEKEHDCRGWSFGLNRESGK